MDKYQLSERDICTKFITPAIQQAGWQQHQFREEVNLTDGRVMVRGKMASRVKNPAAKGGPKRADRSFRGQTGEVLHWAWYATSSNLCRNARRAVCHQ